MEDEIERGEPEREGRQTADDGPEENSDEEAALKRPRQDQSDDAADERTEGAAPQAPREPVASCLIGIAHGFAMLRLTSCSLSCAATDVSCCDWLESSSSSPVGSRQNEA